MPNHSVVLTHNHPLSSSFSDNDIALLLDDPQIKTIIAAGHNGTVYRLSVGSGDRPEFDETTGRDAIIAEYARLLSNNNNDIRLTVSMLAKKYRWKYEVK